MTPIPTQLSTNETLRSDLQHNQYQNIFANETHNSWQLKLFATNYKLWAAVDLSFLRIVWLAIANLIWMDRALPLNLKPESRLSLLSNEPPPCKLPLKMTWPVGDVLIVIMNDF